MDKEYQVLQETYRKLYREYEHAVAEMLKQADDASYNASEFAFASRHVRRISEQLAAVRYAMHVLYGRRGGMVSMEEKEKGGTHC